MKKAIVTGLCRNIEKYIPSLITSLDYISSHFSYTQFIFYEDGSTDNTLKLLIELIGKYNLTILNGNIDPNLSFFNNFQYRENKMTYMRNYLLNYSIHNFPDYDYYIIMDLDDVLNRISGLDEVLKVFETNKNITAQFPVNFKSYYDLYALRDDNIDFSWTDLDVLPSLKHTVRMKINKKYTTPNRLFPVGSAFGGMVIYRFDKIKHINYVYQFDVENKNHPCQTITKFKNICEHVMFNLQLTGLFINSNFKVFDEN